MTDVQQPIPQIGDKFHHTICDDGDEVHGPFADEELIIAKVTQYYPEDRLWEVDVVEPYGTVSYEIHWDVFHKHWDSDPE